MQVVSQKSASRYDGNVKDSKLCVIQKPLILGGHCWCYKIVHICYKWLQTTSTIFCQPSKTNWHGLLKTKILLSANMDP